jgi:hypothetical protein
MKGFLAVTVMALGLAGQVAAEGPREDERATEATRPLFRIHLRAMEVDPGSGAEKLIADMRLVTREAIPESISTGGKIPVKLQGGWVSFEEIGFRVEVSVKSLKDGKLQVDAELKSANLADEKGHRARYTDQVQAGRTIRREIFKDDKESVIYRVEYTVEDARPSKK